VMLRLVLMHELNTRAPLPEEVSAALRQFVAWHLDTGGVVNGLQAQYVVRTYKWLRDKAGETATVDDLERLRTVMLRVPSDELQKHNEIAREIWHDLKRLRGSWRDGGTERIADLACFVEAMTATGSLDLARDLVTEFWANEERRTTNRAAGLEMWYVLLRGLAREGDEDKLLKVVQAARATGVPFNSNFHELIIVFYAARDDVDATKRWFSEPIESDSDVPGTPTTRTLQEILHFSLRTKELTWCSSIFEALVKTDIDKSRWDVVFQWAAGALRKGPEDVGLMMERVRTRSNDDPSLQPDAESINGLVALAVSQHDAYMAERYLALGQKMGIFPNAQTFVMQMDYRIDASDLAGAQQAYFYLQGQEILDDDDLPVINKYIRALCRVTSPDSDRIVSVAADLEERKARLEASTVVALCTMHLRRGEMQAVQDVLATHALHQTKAERARVRDAFLAFCFDRANDEGRAWEAYTIARQTFDEISTAQRTALMREFFARGRSDMALHVFGHMRQHARPVSRPGAATYVACLEGIAAARDAEALATVHNMLKMDSGLDLDTALRNALMLAYGLCGDPHRALDFWADISSSVEGPSYDSLRNVFRVCREKPFGDRLAREIWAKMQRFDIEVTPDVAAAYVGALAGQALLRDAIAAVQALGAEGVEVDVKM
jgi:hypothetical protein